MVTSDENTFEGLAICIKWFCDVLEPSKHKKDLDMSRKVKMTLEEIEKSVMQA